MIIMLCTLMVGLAYYDISLSKYIYKSLTNKFNKICGISAIIIKYLLMFFFSLFIAETADINLFVSMIGAFYLNAGFECLIGNVLVDDLAIKEGFYHASSDRFIYIGKQEKEWFE